jgi:hypothetical protein
MKKKRTYVQVDTIVTSAIRYYVPIPEGEDESYALDGITMGEHPGHSSKHLGETIVSWRWMKPKGVLRLQEQDKQEAIRDRELFNR